MYGTNLVSHGLDGLSPRADELDSNLLQGFLEQSILTEKAIARMDCLSARLLDGFDDLGDGKIGLGRGRRTDADGLICQSNVDRVRICRGVDSDGANAQSFASSDDTTSDLTSIGDQDLLE